MVKLFGSTFAETIAAFKGPHFGVSQDAPVEGDKAKAIGRIIITILLIFVATYCLTSKDNKQLGSTIVGAILGYWLK